MNPHGHRDDLPITEWDCMGLWKTIEIVFMYKKSGFTYLVIS